MTADAASLPQKVTRAQKAAAEKKASVLVEALPYIRRFWGKIVVVKYGGNALHASGDGKRDNGGRATDALASFAQDVVLMRAVGMLPVVVHGGGPQIGELMTRLGKVTEFRDGLRVTDADTLDIARMVLVGKVNRDIVSAINVHGPLAVGMSGEDAKLITAAQTHVDLGFVGNVALVDPTMLQRLVAEGLIPVVATIGADESGQAYNINADTVAGALAEALQAEKLIFLTDIEGLRVVADDPSDGHPAGLARGHRRNRAQRRRPGRHDAQGGGLRARRAGWGEPGPHPRWPGAPRPAARALHRLRRRHHGDAVTSPTPNRTPTPTPGREALMRTYAEPPATFVRGEGTVLYDAAGKSYLDFITGLAVVSLGHAHPSVADAVAEQARTLSHVSNLYGNTLAPEVARTIDRLINGGTGQAGGQVFFANSGAEANECALKLARRWAGGGRYVVISADNSFHGRTLATLTATGQPEKQAPFLPLPEGFVHVPYDDVAALDKALDPDTVAGVLLEPLQGEGGVMVPSSDYLGAVRELVHRAQRAPHARRGADRTRPHRALVRLPGPGPPARRRHHGQGAGQRHAGRRLLGPGRGGRRLRPGRPRLHLRGSAAGAGRGPGHPGRDGGRGRVRPGPTGRRPSDGRTGHVARRRLGARRRPAAGRPARCTRGQGGQPPSPWSGLLVNAVRPDAVRLAPPLLVSDDEIDGALRILGDALVAVRAPRARRRRSRRE